MIDSWHEQLHCLTDAYLQWKLEGPPAMETVTAQSWHIEAHTITCKGSFMIQHI